MVSDLFAVSFLSRFQRVPGGRSNYVNSSSFSDSEIATVGLGVSVFGYRIFALKWFHAWIRCMNSVHRHGHSKGEDGLLRGVHK